MSQSSSSDESEKRSRGRSKKSKRDRRRRSESSSSSSSSSASSVDRKTKSKLKPSSSRKRSSSSSSVSKKQKKRRRSPSSSSSSSPSSYKPKKKTKEKKKKKKHKKEKKKKEKRKKLSKRQSLPGEETSILGEVTPHPGGSQNSSQPPVNTSQKSTDSGPSVGPSPRVMKPMTKDEWEKQQSVMRHVYDEESGRTRLIRGGGEIMEEIVSKQKHKEINKVATQGDGRFFSAKLGLI